MKRLLGVALLAFAAMTTARAQDNRISTEQASGNVAADFASTSAATESSGMSDAWLWPIAGAHVARVSSAADPGAAAEPAEATPASPEPRLVFGSRDDFRWQLALGISLIRFRSSHFYATGVGTNTSVTYFTNEWFAFEGNANTSFAPTINHNHVKFVSYGGGPKIAWRSRQWEPWAHIIAGGMHILPQIAGHSQNGVAFQVGGGVDYRIYPHLSARVEVDWVKTHVFGEWGNSAQANADIVLHF
jgi:opacity protein-like surface antigen